MDLVAAMRAMLEVEEVGDMTGFRGMTGGFRGNGGGSRSSRNRF